MHFDDFTDLLQSGTWGTLIEQCKLFKAKRSQLSKLNVVMSKADAKLVTFNTFCAYNMMIQFLQPTMELYEAEFLKNRIVPDISKITAAILGQSKVFEAKYLSRILAEFMVDR